MGESSQRLTDPVFVKMVQSEAYDNSASEEWPIYCGFKALQASRLEIRLLRADVGPHPTSLQFTMYHAAIVDSPKYIAVSYSWGAPVPESAMKEIIINGEPVRIRPTLHFFLENIVTQRQTTSLWIDAICINQADVQERNQQVSAMRVIYLSAQKVYVWLGNGDDDTNYAMDHITATRPQTRFDRQTFSTSVETILKASYWTRRWVIQEFALARDIIVMCGAHRAEWHKFVMKFDIDMFKNDYQAQNTLERFKELRLLGSGKGMTLLELMERFPNARCINPRDKVFALRGIAADGDQVLPRYDEPVAEVYFRILSKMPTERALPRITGYRWPHEMGSRLLSSMQLTKQDLLNSLVDRRIDRLYATFEYIGHISKVQRPLRKRLEANSASEFAFFPLELNLLEDRNTSFYGSGDLRPEDLVYSLQSSPKSPRGLYIAFRQDDNDRGVAGMLIQNPNPGVQKYWANKGLHGEDIQFIRKVVVDGIVKCSRKTLSGLLKRRVLCHINRLTFLMLWLLEIKQVHCVSDSQKELSGGLVRFTPVCEHTEEDGGFQNRAMDCQSRQCDSLELLPQSHFKEQRFCAEMTTPWTDFDQYRTPEQNKILWDWAPRWNADFRFHGRTELSYAADSGLVLFVHNLLSSRDTEVDSRDDQNRTPLWWAAMNGHEKVVQLLLARGADVNAMDKYHMTILHIAAVKGHGKVVRSLLIYRVDINAQGHDHRSALRLAAEHGWHQVVQVLLANGADPHVGSLVGENIIQSAFKRGHEKVVQVLQENGLVL